MNVICLAVTVAITAQDMDVVAAYNKTHNWYQFIFRDGERANICILGGPTTPFVAISKQRHLSLSSQKNRKLMGAFKQISAL